MRAGSRSGSIRKRIPPQSRADRSTSLRRISENPTDARPFLGAEGRWPPANVVVNARPRQYKSARLPACQPHAVFRSKRRLTAPSFSGKASFYSYSSGKTASGSSFNRNLPTAAHRSLPFGTRVRVTNLANDSSVAVIINDRGPSVRGRVLDLSLAAARSLGMTDRGVANVRGEPL
jgi:rare lipoprotein A (peptidoglycan hydrolase)